MPPKLNTKLKAPDGSAPSTPTKTNAPDTKQNTTGKTSTEVVSEGVSTRRQRGKAKENKEKMICKGNGEKVCHKPVLNDEQGGIECEICLAWYHPACQNLHDDAYETVHKYSLFWICMECRRSVAQFREVVHGKNVTTPECLFDPACLSCIEKKIDNLSKAVSDQAILMKDAVPDADKVNKLYSEVLSESAEKSEVRKILAENIQECFEKIQNEKDEQEKRKCNLSVINLPESRSTSGEDRKKEDITLLSDIIKEELRINVKIENAFRVGAKQNSRPRMMIVTLDSEESKWDVLKAAKMLRESENEMVKNVFINKDLTLQEREKGKKL